VRRLTSWILAACLAAPALLALAVPGVDVDALRCAIACGHEVRSGAVCCPAGADGAAWKTCRPDGATLPGFIPVAAPLLPPTFRLSLPAGSAPLATEPAPRPRSAFDAPPDPVPLSLS